MVAVVMGESFANGLGKTAIVPQAAGLRPSENVVIRFQTASNIGQGRRAALTCGQEKRLGFATKPLCCLVEVSGIEPLTSCMPCKRSTN